MPSLEDTINIEAQDESPEMADEALTALDEEPWLPAAPASPAPAVSSDEPDAPDVSDGHHGWTIMLICLGIGLIAACIIIPQADQNGRMLYQTGQLKTDLEHLQKQVAINEDFIQRAGRDAAISERLAQRQLKFIRRGTAVLDLDELRTVDSSPFSLTMIQGPPAMAEYQSVGGRMGAWCRDGRKRLYTIGAGLLVLAAGLVLGATPAGEPVESSLEAAPDVSPSA